VGALEEPPPTEEKWRIHHGVWFEWLNGNRAAAFPGGENHTQACARMRRGLEAALVGRDGQRVVICGHGGLFLASLGELCPQQNMAILFLQQYHNGSISEIDLTWNGLQWTGALVRWGDTSHLHGDAAQFVPGYPEWKKE
jgi:broad specificity phosphatase PhoE